MNLRKGKDKPEFSPKERSPKCQGTANSNQQLRTYSNYGRMETAWTLETIGLNLNSEMNGWVTLGKDSSNGQPCSGSPHWSGQIFLRTAWSVFFCLSPPLLPSPFLDVSHKGFSCPPLPLPSLSFIVFPPSNLLHIWSYLSICFSEDLNGPRVLEVVWESLRMSTFTT